MSSIAKTVTWILGIAFVAIGVLGFVNDPVLGLFDVDTMHNCIHLLSGLLAIAAAISGESYARLYLIVFGLVYGVVAIIGFITPGTILGLFTVNEADNYLHTAFAVIMLSAGFGGVRR